MERCVIVGGRRKEENMRIRKQILIPVVLVMLLMLVVWLAKMMMPTQVPTAETTTATQQVAVVPEPVVQANPSVQAEGVVSNDDGSIVVRGNASFTVAPASNNRPPAMMPENEARKLSSPPK